jgi:hypothetical protein
VDLELFDGLCFCRGSQILFTLLAVCMRLYGFFILFYLGEFLCYRAIALSLSLDRLC